MNHCNSPKGFWINRFFLSASCIDLTRETSIVVRTSFCGHFWVCVLVGWLTLVFFLHLFQDAFGLPWNAQLQTMQMLGQIEASGLDHKSILKTSGIIIYLSLSSLHSECCCCFLLQTFYTGGLVLSSELYFS